MLYVSGPMSGLPQFNFPAFAHCAEQLRARGLAVVSPHEKGGQGVEGEAAWNQYLRADIVAMMACDAIVLLPGWSKSKGARLELSIALALNFTVWLWNGSELVGFEAAS